MLRSNTRVQPLQIHLAAPPGHGPDYGHFVSKDFVSWASLPTAIWNGLDSSTTPFAVTKYDNEAIFTGSAQIFDGAGPGGKVRKTKSLSVRKTEVGPTPALYSCITTGMRGQTCIFWADLTPFLLKGPGIVNIYPGLCNKKDWPACGTGTLLAQAVPANYAADELLVNWTKPSYVR